MFLANIHTCKIVELHKWEVPVSVSMGVKLYGIDQDPWGKLVSCANFPTEKPFKGLFTCYWTTEFSLVLK